MKIKISELESYEIAIPAGEITSQRFFEILTRLNQVGKMLGKTNIGELMIKQSKFKEVGYKEPRKARGPYFKKYKSKRADGVNLIQQFKADRKLFASLLMDYYYLEEKKFLRGLEKKTGVKLKKKVDFMNKSFRDLRKSLNITPQEVGLEEYPSQGQARKIKYLKDIKQMYTEAENVLPVA